MKIRTSILAGMLFIGSFGAVNSAIAEDGVLSKQEFTPSNYCHMKFPAMRESTIAENHPELNPTGDIIDFSGPCDETPTGKDQVQSQRIANSHNYVTSFYVNK